MDETKRSKALANMVAYWACDMNARAEHSPTVCDLADTIGLPIRDAIEIAEEAVKLSLVEIGLMESGRFFLPDDDEHEPPPRPGAAPSAALTPTQGDTRCPS